MRVRIIAVGKAKDRDLRSLLGDYYARIGRYAKLEEIEIKDGKVDDVAERLARSIPDRSRVVALEVDGRSLSSRGLATWLERAENDSVRGVLDRRGIRPSAGDFKKGRPAPVAVRDDPPAPTRAIVSRGADLPGFFDLARRAVRPLGVSDSDSASGGASVSDRVSASVSDGDSVGVRVM